MEDGVVTYLNQKRVAASLISCWTRLPSAVRYNIPHNVEEDNAEVDRQMKEAGTYRLARRPQFGMERLMSSIDVKTRPAKLKEVA